MTAPDRRFVPRPAPPPVPLVDVHVHLGPSDEGGALYYPLLTGEEYLGLMEVAGVAHACAFSPQRDGYLAANRELRAWAATTDGRILPFARLGGRRVPVTLPALWQVRRKLRALVGDRPPDHDTLDGFAGVKLLPHLDGLPDDDVLDEIEARGLPTLVHGGVHVPADWIEQRLLSRLRTAPLIVGHLGSYPGSEPHLRAAVRLAARRDNVWVETSGAWMASFVAHAVAAVPRKVLFGSDAPLAHPAVAWSHVASVVDDPHLLAAVARDNARAVLGDRITS